MSYSHGSVTGRASTWSKSCGGDTHLCECWRRKHGWGGGGIQGRRQSLKSRCMKKDQAPTRVIPVEVGRSGSGEGGPQVRVLLKTLQMEAEQLPRASVPSMPSTACALHRGIVLNSNLLASTKTPVLKMQYCIFSFHLFHVSNIVKY